MIKKLKLLILVIVGMLGAGVFVLSLFPDRFFEYKVSEQPSTKWMSEDGDVMLFVTEEDGIQGVIKYEGDEIQVYVAEEMNMATGMHLFKIDATDDGILNYPDDEEYEHWKCSYKSRKEFVATVLETTFFEKGQEITFHRVDEK